MTTRSVPSWAVAAAILLVEDCPKHYKNLTSDVIDTGMSDLGGTGPTPRQTLRADIATKHSDIFEGDGARSGIYRITNEAAALRRHDVRRAVSRLADVSLDRYQKLIQNLVHNAVDLSKRDAGKAKADLETLERRLAHIARLYSTKTEP